MRVLPKRGSRSRCRRSTAAGVFEAFLPRRKPPLEYRLEATWLDGYDVCLRRPVCIPAHARRRRPLPDRRGAARGAVRRARGARARAGGHRGTSFAVWAPAARSVSVVGDFNNWDGRVHQLRSLGSSGVWELFVPGIETGSRYKYEIRHGERATAPEGRSARLGRRAAACQRLHRVPVAVRVERRRVARERASAPRPGRARCPSTRCTCRRGA